MIVIRQKRITREEIWANPNIAYLFGDNLLKLGTGGQAYEMRGEPNSIGVPTKKKPCLEPDCFMTDDEYEANTKAIADAINKAKDFDAIVVSYYGLGTGLAFLKSKAPKTFKFLEEYLKYIEEN